MENVTPKNNITGLRDPNYVPKWSNIELADRVSMWKYTYE